ncbi:MAG TPA: hypothetical protein VHM20_02370 [Gammaproteobacteria bacterium]|jgi:hypothetical protein|nr:hypothetical protein [Gammaproteobacteria bacterium]
MLNKTKEVNPPLTENQRAKKSEKFLSVNCRNKRPNTVPKKKARREPPCKNGIWMVETPFPKIIPPPMAARKFDKKINNNGDFVDYIWAL